MPPKRGSSVEVRTAPTATGGSSSVALYLGIVVLLFVVFGCYYWFKVRGGLVAKKKHQISRRDVLGVPDTQHRPAVAEPAPRVVGATVPPEKALTTMYVPKEVGHRTGQARVFITNKGLRVYETNEHGCPMPVPQSSLNSQTPP